MTADSDVVVPPPAPTKSDLIKKIGATLTEKRKLRGLTQEKAGLAIKIRATYIKALEEGNWQELPGEIYARGFVARYAQFLGLDGKEILSAYFQSGTAEPIYQRTTSPKNPAKEFSKTGWVWGGVGLVFVFGLIKVIVSDHQNAHQIAAKTAPDKIVVAASTAVVAAVQPVVQGAEHTLGIFSPFPLWLSVKADNRAFEGFIPQGTTWSWKAQGYFNVRIGHTQEITMLFDGTPVVLAENQKRVTLPREN